MSLEMYSFIVFVIINITVITQTIILLQLFSQIFFQLIALVILRSIILIKD